MEAVIHSTLTWLGPPPPFGAPPCQDQCKGWSLSSTCSRTPTWRRIWRRVQERGISIYTCNVSIMRYFRVTFHNASTHPLVDEFGHNVQPYTSTNFAINKVCVDNPWRFITPINLALRWSTRDRRLHMTQIVTKIGQGLITQIYFSIQQTGLTHSRYPSIGTFKTWQNSKLWIASAAMLEVLHAGLHNARLRVFPSPVPGYWRHEAGARRLQPRQHHHHRLRGHHPRPDRGGPEDLPLPPVLWPDPLPDLRLRSLLAV